MTQEVTAAGDLGLEAVGGEVEEQDEAHSAVAQKQ